MIAHLDSDTGAVFRITNAPRKYNHVYNINKKPVKLLYDERGHLSAAQFDKYGRLLYQVFDRSGQIVYNRKRQPLKPIYDLCGRPKSTVYNRQSQMIEAKFDKRGRPIAYLFDKQGIPLYDAEGKPWTDIETDLEAQNDVRKTNKAKTHFATTDDIMEIKDSIDELKQQILLIKIAEEKCEWASKHYEEHIKNRATINNEVDGILAHVIPKVRITDNYDEIVSQLVTLKVSKSLLKSHCLKDSKIAFSGNEPQAHTAYRKMRLRKNFIKREQTLKENIHHKHKGLTIDKLPTSILKTSFSRFPCQKGKVTFSDYYNSGKKKPYMSLFTNKKSKNCFKMRKEINGKREKKEVHNT